MNTLCVMSVNASLQHSAHHIWTLEHSSAWYILLCIKLITARVLCSIIESIVLCMHTRHTVSAVARWSSCGCLCHSLWCVEGKKPGSLASVVGAPVLYTYFVVQNVYSMGAVFLQSIHERFVGASDVSGTLLVSGIRSWSIGQTIELFVFRIPPLRFGHSFLSVPSTTTKR